jgi:hypothetical protein
MIGLILCGCEVIDEKDRLLPVPIPTMSDGRTHVLVEFTGFRCVNCPSAAQTAQALKDIYDGRLVVVALHPESNPFTQGLYDYTCPEADEVYRFMGGTATTPFPTGNIDMQATENGYFIDPIEWAARLRTVMADTVWNPHSRYDVSYWLVEDSVLGAQAMPDGSVNMHYYHRHVLRAISATPFEQVPEKCDPAQCSVVTVYSDTNDKHILHAYETPFDLSAHR